MGHPRPEGGKPRGGPAGVASGPPPKPALKQEEGMPAGGTHGPARSWPCDRLPADPRSYTGCPGPNGREDVPVAAENTACDTSRRREGRAPGRGSSVTRGHKGGRPGGSETTHAQSGCRALGRLSPCTGPRPSSGGSQAWEGLRQQLP